MSDQESPLRTLFEHAIHLAGASGELVEAIPERSAVGESQSNGKAERAVQEAEDNIRTMKLALEERLGCRLGSQSPVMKWLCEHVAANLNRFNVGDDGCTPYQRLHGKRYSGHVLELGEKIHFFTPARTRTKLDKRWHDGMYLGTSLVSNEHFVANERGGISRAMGIARVKKEVRWDRAWAQRIIGTPMKPNTDAVIE